MTNPDQDMGRVCAPRPWAHVLASTTAGNEVHIMIEMQPPWPLASSSCPGLLRRTHSRGASGPIITTHWLETKGCHAA